VGLLVLLLICLILGCASDAQVDVRAYHVPPLSRAARPSPRCRQRTRCTTPTRPCRRHPAPILGWRARVAPARSTKNQSPALSYP